MIPSTTLPSDYVLLGGSGSSGTTLVASVLDGLHDVRTSAETWLFHHREVHTEPRRLRELLDQGLPGHTRTVDRLSLPLVPGGCFAQRDQLGVDDALLVHATTLDAFVPHVKAAMAARWGGPAEFLWLDQTPKNGWAAREYLTASAGGRFVHVLRDGRDVVCSLLRRWQKTAPGHPLRTYLIGAAQSWTWDVTVARRAQGVPGYLELRYERFVQDPVAATNLVLQHLGRPPVDPATFAANRARDRAQRLGFGVNEGAWGATPDQPIRTDSVGRHKRMLQPSVVQALRDVSVVVPGEGRRTFGATLDACGYWG